MADTRRSDFAKASLTRAQQMPDTARNRVIVEQTSRTVERALKSEQTMDSGKPRPK